LSTPLRKFNFTEKKDDSSEMASEAGILKFNNLQNGKKSTGSFHESKAQHFDHKKNKIGSSRYFAIKNHLDLFELGRHYTRLYECGMHSFAFYGAGPQKHVQQTLLGLASFFNYHKNEKVLLFIEKLEGSEIGKYITHFHTEVLPFNDSDETFEINISDGLEIIEYSQLRHLAYKMGEQAFSMFLNSVINNAKIIFWELPYSEKISKDCEFFLPIAEVISNFTFVVTNGVSRQSELKNMFEFAEKNQIITEGVIVYKDDSLEKKDRDRNRS